MATGSPPPVEVAGKSAPTPAACPGEPGISNGCDRVSMDLVRFGRIVRALRRRRGWRQQDLADRVGVSQSLISLVERGHGDRVALRTLLRIAAALDARLVLDLRWRAGDLDRLLDEGHAAIGAEMAARLGRHAWRTAMEVTYADGSSSGSIDILGWHEASRSLLVIENKTEITSGEATLRKLDEKERVAPRLAEARFGWSARTVSRLLVVDDTTTARRRVAAHAALFDSALPLRGVDVSRWIRSPDGAVAGLLFLPVSNRGGVKRERSRFHRVRVASRPRRPAI